MSINNENIAAGADAGKGGAMESDDECWLEACRREEAIRGLLKRSDGERLSLSDAEAVALDFGISRATLYRLIAVYRQTPTVKALEPKHRGRRNGVFMLDKAHDKLIHQTIREIYLKPTRPTMAHLVEQVHLRFAR